MIAVALIKLTTKKDEFQRGVIISISLTILASILFLRFESDRLIEPIKAAAKALKEEKISNTLIAYHNAKEGLSVKDNNVMEKALNLRFKDFKKAITNLERTGVLEVSLDDLEVIALDVISSAKNSIKATSYVDSSQWWRKPWGKRYFRLNEEKIKNGVVINRIFIFENEAAKKRDIELLICSSLIDVKVHVLLLSNLSRPLGEDVIIIIDDNILAGQLVLGTSKIMKASNFSSDHEFIAERNTKYEIALLNSEPYTHQEGEECSLYALENEK